MHHYTGNYKWFLTGETNELDNTDPTIQIGCFQVLKGYLPHQRNILQMLFFRAQRLDASYVLASGRRVNLKPYHVERSVCIRTRPYH
jgi:hypothetical protein